MHFKNLYSEFSWRTLIFLNFDTDFITVKLSNSSYTNSYLINGLVYQESITKNLNIEINNLTISSGTFFFCPTN